MQPTAPLMQLLQLMDNLIIVAIFVVVVIAIRFGWVWLQRSHGNSSQSTGPVGKRDARGKVTVKQPVAKKKDVTLEIIDTVLIALILVFGIVRPFFLQTFFIPSESMMPTLYVQDKLIANKFIYRFRQPQRGEVIVFQPPIEALIGNDYQLSLRAYLESLTPAQWNRVLQQNPSFIEQMNNKLELKLPSTDRATLLAVLPEYPRQRDDFIKRVIGVPHDRIRVVKGEGVYVNGTLLLEPYLPNSLYTSDIDFPERANLHDVETVQPMEPLTVRDAYLYQVYLHRIKPYVKNGEFIVPDGMVFVMGDNRQTNRSFDSRFWGPVPIKDVKARAISTFWPLNRLKLL